MQHVQCICLMRESRQTQQVMMIVDPMWSAHRPFHLPLALLYLPSLTHYASLAAYQCACELKLAAVVLLICNHSFVKCLMDPQIQPQDTAQESQ